MWRPIEDTRIIFYVAQSQLSDFLYLEMVLLFSDNCVPDNENYATLVEVGFSISNVLPGYALLIFNIYALFT